MVNAYVVTSNRVYDPITIIAHSNEQAFLNFMLWCERHAPQGQDGDTEVVQITDKELSLQPQLRDALMSGHVGVAWWVGHREGWLITPPDYDAAGELTPPSPPIKCFAFTGCDEFDTFYVFTKSLELAEIMLELHGVARFGSDIDYEEVTELSPWLLTNEKLPLREQMFEGVTGVGMGCDDGLWRILPADWDQPGSVVYDQPR